MWKRERPEPVDLEHVMSEAPVMPVNVVRPVAPAPLPSVPVAAPAAESASERAPVARGSALGATLRFKGDLVADEDLVIQGQVEGSILHTRSLTIGAQGRMRGDIRARRIVVEGTVEGNLYALESVNLRRGATVRGDVFSASVAIDDGARLTGRIDMDNAPAVPTVRVATREAQDAPPLELSPQAIDTLLTGS
jgi:cytoskeletal protein CcmA (bactofilin family)